jgi:hypothetical protein
MTDPFRPDWQKARERRLYGNLKQVRSPLILRAVQPFAAGGAFKPGVVFCGRTTTQRRRSIWRFETMEVPQSRPRSKLNRLARAAAHLEVALKHAVTPVSSHYQLIHWSVRLLVARV